MIYSNIGPTKEKLSLSRKEIVNRLSNKTIFRLKRGIYSDHEFNSFLQVVPYLYPQGIFCSYSAFYYWGMTDVIPQQYHLAIKRNGTRIKNKNVLVKYYNSDTFLLGATVTKYANQKIRIYDKERLLVNLIIERNSIESDYYREIIRYYREHKEEIDQFLIEEYVSHMRNPKYILETIYKEVF